MSIWQLFSTANISFCDEDDEGECGSVGDLIPDDIGAMEALGGLIKYLVGAAEGLGADKMLIDIIILFAAFTASIKLFLGLLNKYLVLVIGPILGPAYFFFAALPSQSGSTIVSFVKMHLGAALTFISVYALFLFIIVFVRMESTPDLNWIPPMMGYGADKFVAGNLIHYLVAYGAFLISPSIPKMIDSFLDIPSSMMIAQQFGQSMGGGASAALGWGKTMGRMAAGKSHIGEVMFGR
jgi:hypothetical protein